MNDETKNDETRISSKARNDETRISSKARNDETRISSKARNDETRISSKARNDETRISSKARNDETRISSKARNTDDYDVTHFKSVIKYASSNKDIMELIENGTIIPNLSIFRKAYEEQSLKGITDLRKKYGDRINFLNDDVMMDKAFKERKNKIIKWYLFRSKKDIKLRKRIIGYMSNVDIHFDREIIEFIIEKFDDIANNDEFKKYVKLNISMFSDMVE